MNKIPKFFILVLFTSLMICSLHGQDVQVLSRTDTNNVLIGDQIKLTLQAQAKSKTNVVFPSIPDTLGKLEVVSRSNIDTVDTNGRYILRQNFVITCFDTGYFEVPAFVFMYEKKGMTSLYPAETQKYMLRFNTVQVDTTKDIKDIKPPLEIPFNIWDYIEYIIAALIVIALAVAGYFIWKRYKKKPSEILNYDPKIPPDTAALEALNLLEREKLWQKGKVKEYYIRLTEIIRLYIERSFGVSALEMVSDDIIAELKQTKIDDDLITKLALVFNIADLVKFAKKEPLPDENSMSMNYCVEFVTGTVNLIQDDEDENKGEKKS